MQLINQALSPTKLGQLILTEQTAGYYAGLENLVNLIGKTKDNYTILKQILPLSITISQADLGALLVVENIDSTLDDDQTQQLVLVAQHNLSADMINYITAGDMSKALQTGKKVWVGLQAMQLNHIQALLRRHQLRGLLGLPLHFCGHFLGSLIVGARSNNSTLFQPETRQRLAGLAHLLSLFLDHIRLQRQEQNRGQHGVLFPGQKSAPEPLEAPVDTSHDEFEHLLAAVMSAEEEVASHNQDLGLLNALSTQVSGTLNLSQILDNAVAYTKNALNVDAGWIYLADEGKLVLRAQSGLSQTYTKGLKLIKPGDGSEGMAYQRQIPVLRDSLLFHSGPARQIVKREGIVTVAAVPLTHQGISFGALATGMRTTRRWTARDERMLLSISQQISQALSNAQSFDQVSDKAQLLEQRNRALQEANQDLLGDFDLLKQQIQGMLRLQEHAWITLANLSDDETASATIHDERQEIISTLKRVLDTTH